MPRSDLPLSDRVIAIWARQVAKDRRAGVPIPVRKKLKSAHVKKRCWVVKAGSQLVCGGGPLLIRDWAHQILSLKQEFNIDVVWVSSGAISSAVDRTGRRNNGRKTLAEKQALSALGQPIVMDLYNLALHNRGLLGAQVLLTYDDLADAQRRRNLLNTLRQLLKWNAVPIINENDTVATEEIQFGDNDSLSAKVAMVLKAERLVILSDVQGLCTSDPSRHPDAKLISDVRCVTRQIMAIAPRQTKSKRGRGGMHSKLLAGSEASRHGIDTFLVKGDRPGVLLELARGEVAGTWIHRQ